MKKLLIMITFLLFGNIALANGDDQNREQILNAFSEIIESRMQEELDREVSFSGHNCSDDFVSSYLRKLERKFEVATQLDETILDYTVAERTGQPREEIKRFIENNYIVLEDLKFEIHRNLLRRAGGIPSVYFSQSIESPETFERRLQDIWLKDLGKIRIHKISNREGTKVSISSGTEVFLNNRNIAFHSHYGDMFIMLDDTTEIHLSLQSMNDWGDVFKALSALGIVLRFNDLAENCQDSQFASNAINSRSTCDKPADFLNISSPAIELYSNIQEII